MVSSDAPQFLDNDGDPPMWVRSDLAVRPEEVLSWMVSEFGWDDEAITGEVSGPFPTAPTSAALNGEERWEVVTDDVPHVRYWKIDP